jgi:hypothetical protein
MFETVPVGSIRKLCGDRVRKVCLNMNMNMNIHISIFHRLFIVAFSQNFSPSILSRDNLWPFENRVDERVCVSTRKPFHLPETQKSYPFHILRSFRRNLPLTLKISQMLQARSPLDPIESPQHTGNHRVTSIPSQIRWFSCGRRLSTSSLLSLFATSTSAF